MMKSLLHNRMLQQICLRLRMNLTNVLLMKKLRKKAMEDALADEMNIHKKINQTKENINQIRFKLHEAEEKTW